MAKKLLKSPARAIIERNTTEDDRAKVSLYLSKSLYERFKKACGKASASKVMEDLLEEFLENLKES